MPILLQFCSVMNLNDSKTAPLQRAQVDFIELWGEMAASWGISKTMAQIYALLYSSPTPLDTDEIMSSLSVSRGNANMNLHKLLNWGLIAKVEKIETRRDYFSAEKDVWRLTLRIIEARQKRELKPLTESLAEIADSMRVDEMGGKRLLSDEEQDFADHIAQMTNFIQQFTLWTAKLLPLLRDADPAQLNLLIDALASLQKHPQKTQ